MSQISFKMGLRIKSILTVFLSALILIVALLFYVLPEQDQEAVDSLTKFSKQHLETLSTGVVSSLLQRQYASLYELMDSQHEASSHWKILILEVENGLQIYPLATKKIDLHPNEILIETDILFLDEKLGKLTLVINISSELEIIHWQLYKNILVVLGVLFFLLLIILLFIEKTITQPLENLSSAFEKLGEKVYDYNLPKPHGDEVGEVIKGFKIMRDNLHSDEMKMNRLYEDEKSMSEERRLMLKELESAREMAEQSSRIKSEFLANMSHEIRTPMNGIINLVKLSLEEPDLKKQHYYLEQVEQSSELLLDIINDILDFSKIEAGKLTISKHHFNLIKLLNLLENIFALKAEGKTLVLNFVQGKNLPPILIGDELRLKQILINLIGNAIKFTEKGSVTVHIELIARSETNHVLLKFSIIDTGIGIVKEKVPELFHAFVQAEDSTTRQFGGSGLGLSISDSLVKLLGGKLNAESKLGEGSCFYFQLPFQVSTEKPTLLTDSPTKVLNNLSGKHLLVAEDNKTNRLVMKVILEQEHIDFDMVENGQQALKALESKAYDAILMDIQMPVLNGLDATKKIRESNEHYQNIPIIAMTAYAIEGDKESCLESGMNAYVSKPIDRTEFLVVLSQELSKSP